MGVRSSMVMEAEDGATGVRHSDALRELHPESSIISLHLWQEQAIDKWRLCDPNLVQGEVKDKEYRGIVQAVTGAGKTVFAMECIWVWLQEHPAGNVTVLVPTRALQRQWRAILRQTFDLPVGVYGGGRKEWKQINVATMNTAAKGLPNGDMDGDHLIVCDECHNLGSESRRYAVLNNKHTAVLGLSATPEREDSGLSVVSYICGPVVYRYGYDDARLDDVIMPFVVRAVATPLTRYEMKVYEELSEDIKKIGFIIRGRYGPETNPFTIKQDPSDPDRTVDHFKKLCRDRKDIVNRAYHRFSCIDAILEMHEGARGMIFHERIDQVDWMVEKYSGYVPETLPDGLTTWDEAGIAEPYVDQWADINPAVYHGNKSTGDNDRALEAFKTGESQLLFSVKALREGVDVPDADLGIMVSGTNATRARVQTLGRCLRKGEADEAVIYLLYVPGTTDAKGLANLKHRGRLPAGAIEFWNYNGESLTKVGREDATLGRPKRDSQTKMRKRHICPDCKKDFYSADAAKKENHFCAPHRTKGGRRPINVFDLARRNKRK
jgi:superfamily II DNA or RNA helicase